ncbi:ATP-dependent DNA helicase Q4 isoform X2 [Spea bombifrons]|uniref:ATP-dependent DNA helicase Q4 isoform X2 n=1 Tax=Spea bombifrons TaxID=233779 RepID=UPI00234A2923|nr:ATP-dependent DNA helicase Q4 isoform X2 [Spea bombifrons]
MERYDAVKCLLKKWENEFLKQHERKPNRVDVENAPEETRALYKEYRALKRDLPSENNGPTGDTSDVPAKSPKSDKGHQVSSSWGEHLNRANETPANAPKMSSKERESLKASAQYFGMKLKANFGSAVKERPTSLRKAVTRCASPAPDRRQSATLNVGDSGSPAPAVKSADPASECDGSDLLLPQRMPPIKTSLTPQRSKKLHQLQTMVGQRMTSLNPDWLERCELLKEGGSLAEGGRCRITGGTASNVTKKFHAQGWECGSLGADSPSSNAQREQSDSLMEPKELPPCTEEPSPSPCLDQKDTAAAELTSCRETEGRPHSQAGSLLPYKDSAADERVNRDFEATDRTVDETAVSLSRNRHGGRTACSGRIQRADGKSQEAEETLSGRGRGNRQKAQAMDNLSSGACKVTCNETDGTETSRRVNRKRKTPADPPQGLSPENCKKRRKTKPKNKLKSECTSETPEAGGTEQNQETPLERPLKQNLMARATENLLGDVDEEAAPRMVARSERNARAPQRKTENFVRINLKKKTYVKGYVLNGTRLRKQMWKQKWQKKGEQFGGGGKHFNRGEDTCFRCGRTGHWASQCPGAVPVQPLKESDPEEDEVELPTLEEVARKTNTQYRPDAVSAPTRDLSDCSPGAVAPLDVVRPQYEPPKPPPPMQPLYELEPGGRIQEAPAEVYEALSELGYQSFRPGQEEAVMRILSGLSSLVILSTGMGKSLCYQLPAYIYAKRSPCITLVISPLVSLMDDQVSGLPSKLKAVCIHSNMTKIQREAAMAKVKEGKVHVLLLSPEALVGGGYSGSSCLPPADQLPPVAFACIDEAHCVSEWSHNFRPCYLRLCKVLRERLGVRCLLGLTATATMATAQDVAHHLGVTEDGGIPVRLAGVPPNLHLSASMDRDKDQALVTLLKGERFGCLDSVIVYCTRREETTRISALLRTCLQGVTVNKSQSEAAGEEEDPAARRKKAQARKKLRKPLKWVADAYHAGMSAAERRRVQNNFMSGQLRLVVATVAFGMGLDKSDVRGVIHYNMPKNFESYVQEIGRSGRDGKDAQCHLFLDPEAQDLDELRRHVYADSMDYFTLKRLVQRVFPKCKCRDIHRKQEALKRACEVDDSEMMDIMEACEEPAGPCAKEQTVRVCHMHERAFPIEESVQALDVREEGLETLLCYLELHANHWLELLHPTLSVCRVTCYGGPRQLQAVAKSCPPVAVALARERLSGVDHTHVSSVEFNVVELADTMGWEIIPVKRALRDLQWTQKKPGVFSGTGKSGVLVEFSKLSFHFRSFGDLADRELEEICDFLHQKVTSRERTALLQLTSCYHAFHSVAYRSSSACAEQVNTERSGQLKALLLEYFEKRDPLVVHGVDSSEEDLTRLKVLDWEDQIRSDIRHFLSIHQDERFSGRAIARIFHGIGSPCYPAQIYGRDRRFWRKYIHLDFNELIRLSKEEIIRLR